MMPPLALSKILRFTVIFAVVASISACSWNDNRTAKLGGVAGGVVGGILGSKMGQGVGRDAAMILGATLGSMWGQDIAKSMTDMDKIFARRSTEDTLEYGKPGDQTTWSNPDSGNSGRVEAGDTFKNDAGKDCRQFETTANVDNEQQSATGTACRMSNGTWQVVEEPT